MCPCGDSEKLSSTFEEEKLSHLTLSSGKELLLKVTLKFKNIPKSLVSKE